jgi:hypothetical protein
LTAPRRLAKSRRALRMNAKHGGRIISKASNNPDEAPARANETAKRATDF